MKMTAAKMTILIGGASLFALIGCVTALSWHGIIDGQAAIAFFTGLSLAGVVGGAQHVGVQSGARAALSEQAADRTTRS